VDHRLGGQRELRQTPGRSLRSDRLAKDSKWSHPMFQADEPRQKIAALVLAGDQVLAAGSQGGLLVLSATDGQLLAARSAGARLDGLAAAGGRLFVSTMTGEVLCLGGSSGRRNDEIPMSKEIRKPKHENDAAPATRPLRTSSFVIP